MNKIKYLIFILFLFFQLAALSQNNDAELICNETLITVDNGKLNIKKYNEIKINNRSGEEYCDITIIGSSMCRVKNIDAYIKNSNGEVLRKIKKKDIKERSSDTDSFYEDKIEYNFMLKHNSYPYSIVYSYETNEEEFIGIDHWIPVVDYKVPTRNAKLKATFPLDYKINYSQQKINSFKIDSTENEKIYTWETSYENELSKEIYAPPINDFMPQVTIVPRNFNFDKSGSFADWTSFGNWVYSLNSDLSDLSNSFKNNILNSVNPIDNKKEIIKKLYHDLQDETRYINVTIETGGLKPFPASYVENNKYGDCKALTNYFKSVLEVVGIEAFYTLVYAGNPIDKIEKDFLSSQFNHIILFIPLKNDTLWLDCTSKYAFNYLGTFTQNRNAFIIDNNKSRFIKTSQLTNNQVLEKRKIHFSKNTDGTTSVNCQEELKGEMYEVLAGLNRMYKKTDKNLIVRNYFVEDNFDLINYNIELNNRDSANATLNYTATAHNIFNQYGNEILIKMVSFSIPGFEDPENRKLPVQINYPIHKIDTLFYKIPEGFSASVHIKNISLNSEFGKYYLNFYVSNNTLEITKLFLLNNGIIKNENYTEFYNFIDKIKHFENTSIILTKNN